jgi:hypothetical protein
VGSTTLRSPLERLSSGSSWIKSSLSYANGNCVEVASLPGAEIGVRNSRDSGGPVLRFTSDEWDGFLCGVRNGEFDSFGSSDHMDGRSEQQRTIPGPGSPPPCRVISRNDMVMARIDIQTGMCNNNGITDGKPVRGAGPALWG